MRDRTARLAAIAAAVRELAEADVVAFGGVGIAGRTLPVTEAFQTLEGALPEHAEALRPQLAWLLANGSAAGKAYAATLLGRFDVAAARSAWQSVIADRSEFTTLTGCIMNRTTLGEYAAGRIVPA